MTPAQYERERQYHLRQRQKERARLLAFWVIGPLLGFAVLATLLLIDRAIGR